MEYTKRWTKLDNAAKIFPPTTTNRDTKVFRFSCELYEDVDPFILQDALDKTMVRFPFFRSILKRGFFWYYFEETGLRPLVKEEQDTPCKPIYNPDYADLLFEVTYYRRRINFEIYHALSDGTGAMQFLRTLVFYYLKKKHRDSVPADMVLGDLDAPEDQKRSDAFDKYYSKDRIKKNEKLPRAYRIRGEPFSDQRMGVIEGCLSTAAMIGKAREYGVTVTEFITALLIMAIHENMNVRDESLPIAITVPVNLRNYFSHPTIRNFFSTINISYNFRTSGGTFDELLASVKESFKRQLQADNIYGKMNQLIALEHRGINKIVPLILKTPVMKFFSALAERDDSAALSNLGRVTMPAELVPHIRLFDLIISTKRPQICLCSFEDRMAITFSSPFRSSDIQRYFFRTLSGYGMEIEIVSNTVEIEEDADALVQ